MTPQTAIEALDAAIAGYGQSVTLQRTAVDGATGGITIAEEITCAAAVRNFGPQDLEAGEVQEIRVYVSPTGLGAFGIPSRDDRILIEGNPSNIVQIAPLYYGGALCRVNCSAVAEFPEWSAAQQTRLWQQAEMFFDPKIFRDTAEVYEWLKKDTEQVWLAYSPETRREIAAEHPDGVFAEWLTRAS